MYSVRDFIELSARELGWNKKESGKTIIWGDRGLEEIGKRVETGEVVEKVDYRYFRPIEV